MPDESRQQMGVVFCAVPRHVRATQPLTLEAQPALVTVPNVELLEVGEDWETSTGVFSFTVEDLVSAVQSQEDPAVRTPVLKLGHVDPRFDGQPSFGRIENLSLTNNHQTLLGDLVGVPLWLAQCMSSAYPRRSIEGQFGWKTQTGNEWGFVLTALALLGAAYPAITTLEDVKALWGATPPPLYPATEANEDIAASLGSIFRARKVIDMPIWRKNKTVEAGSTSFGDLPLADRDMAWSRSTADSNVRAWASSDGSGDADKMDWTKYRKAFFWYDSDNADQFGSYKLMFADMVDGKLTAVPRGVFACAGVCMGARGGVDIPDDDLESVKNTVARYYTKMAKQFDDDGIVPPWEMNMAASRKVRAQAGLDDVRQAYYNSLNSAQMWWWIREIRVNPLELIVDDDEGTLYRVPVQIDNQDNITFGPPQAVKVEYVNATGGQLVAASFNDSKTSGRPSRKPESSGVVHSAEGDKEERMPDPKILEALGLKSDATQEEVDTAILQRLSAQPTEGEGEGAGKVTTEPGTTTPGTSDEPKAQPEAPEAPAEKPTDVQVPEGMVLVDAAQWANVQQGVAAAQRLEKEAKEKDRDAILNEAVRAGKFPPSRRAHYLTSWEADPEGTKNIIASLAPGLVPVQERGQQGGETNAKVESAAYPDSWKGTVAATRRDTSTRVKVVND